MVNNKIIIIGLGYMLTAQASIQVYYLKDHPEYIETCAQWSFDTWGHHVPHKSLQDFIESRKEYLNDDCLPFTLIACDNEILVGMCSLTVNRGLLPELTPWLAALYVQPVYRGRGIGKLLVEAVCEKACYMGYKNIYCFTSDKSLVFWYEKRGWQQRGIDRIHNHDVIVMEKPLGVKQR